jgi:hypothetical protein
MSQQSSFLQIFLALSMATTSGNIAQKYGGQCKSLKYAVTIVGETKLHLLRHFLHICTLYLLVGETDCRPQKSFAILGGRACSPSRGVECCQREPGENGE